MVAVNLFELSRLFLKKFKERKVVIDICSYC